MLSETGHTGFMKIWIHYGWDIYTPIQASGLTGRKGADHPI